MINKVKRVLNNAARMKDKQRGHLYKTKGVGKRTFHSSLTYFDWLFTWRGATIHETAPFRTTAKCF